MSGYQHAFLDILACHTGVFISKSCRIFYMSTHQHAPRIVAIYQHFGLHTESLLFLNILACHEDNNSKQKLPCCFICLDTSMHPESSLFLNLLACHAEVILNKSCCVLYARTPACTHNPPYFSTSRPAIVA